MKAMEPLKLFKESWNMGYFYNVGRIDLETLNIPTYGFYHSATGSIVDEVGEALGKMPKLLGLTAYDGTGAVAFKVTQELIINPALLEDGNPPSQSDFCIKFPEILRRLKK